MFWSVPEVILNAGVMALFSFFLLGTVVWQLKAQQTLITNHIHHLTEALLGLKDAVDRLERKL